jgi:hypothetical protein
MSTQCVTILATGASITTGAASAQVAIPNTSAGTKPVRIRVAATAAAHVRLGVAAATATTADTLVQAGDAVVMTVPRGVGFIAAIQNAATGTVQIAPLEDA